MAMLLKFLPVILLALWVWWLLTAHRRLEKSLRAMSQPLNDPAVQSQLLEFSTALGAKPFDVKILDLEQINAIALPSGEIYIWRGLYDRYRSGLVTHDELAAVLAHEIGHVALGHARRRVEISRAQITMLALIGFLFGRLLFGWWALLAWLGLSVLNGQTAQKQEFEADAFAAQLLMRTGVNPRMSISILRKVDMWGGSPPDQPIPIRWIMTHPSIDDRIAWLEQVIAAGVPAKDDPTPRAVV